MYQAEWKGNGGTDDFGQNGKGMKKLMTFKL